MSAGASENGAIIQITNIDDNTTFNITKVNFSIVVAPPQIFVDEVPVTPHVAQVAWVPKN